MRFIMAEEFVFPKSRLEFARVLKDNDNCILTTLNFLGQYIDLDLDTRKNLEAVFIRIRSKVKKAKKSLDCLEGEWCRQRK